MVDVAAVGEFVAADVEAGGDEAEGGVEGAGGGLGGGDGEEEHFEAFDVAGLFDYFFHKEAAEAASSPLLAGVDGPDEAAVAFFEVAFASEGDGGEEASVGERGIVEGGEDEVLGVGVAGGDPEAEDIVGGAGDFVGGVAEGLGVVVAHFGAELPERGGVVGGEFADRHEGKIGSCAGEGKGMQI